MYKHNKYLLLYSLLLISSLDGNQGCDISSLLEENQKSIDIKEKKIKEKNIELKITETLSSITIVHENQPLRIKRTPRNQEHTCPPFCIQPMNIKGVRTVGELEVLDFIKDLKGKEAQLLIDVRKSKQYNQYTIPGAINIPFSMLKRQSKYQKQVLELLGGKKQGEKWIFKYVPKLLIFGESNEDNTARKSIEALLELSYPNQKINYYRAGIESWSRLGLTLY
jgi:hypothetical protein